MCLTTGRYLLIRILEAFATKLSAMKVAFPSIMKYYHRRKAQADNPSENFASHVELDGFLDLGYAQPMRTSLKSLDTTVDIIKGFLYFLRLCLFNKILDTRQLFMGLIKGIKTILHAIRAIRSSFMQSVSGSMDVDNHNFVVGGFSEDEALIFMQIFKDGFKCFDYFISDHFGPDGLMIGECVDRHASTLSKDEKDVMECFASIFNFVEPSLFQEIFSLEIPYLFDYIMTNTGMQIFPQYLLGLINMQSSHAPNFINYSTSFASLLIKFLVDRMEMLGGENLIQSTTILKLFKLVFLAITKYPEKNEAVLRPYVGTIILKAMTFSSKSKDPLHYFLLLRSLFRSIGGGRFESLYQEVLPLLEVLLEGLNALLATAHNPQMKDLFVELCLTVPVRLSVLLPYLSFVDQASYMQDSRMWHFSLPIHCILFYQVSLMKPLVLALQAGHDLVSQGLRTLELCIDNLTQDFLEPIMSPVIGELMTALWKHLRPLPYKAEYSHTAMRILGKLGGRNRRLLNESIRLN